MEIVVLFVWIVGVGAVAFIANERGRSGVAWGVVAFLLSPLFGYAVLVAIPVLRTSPVTGLTSAEQPDRRSYSDAPVFNRDR